MLLTLKVETACGVINAGCGQTNTIAFVLFGNEIPIVPLLSGVTSFGTGGSGLDSVLLFDNNGALNTVLLLIVEPSSLAKLCASETGVFLL